MDESFIRILFLYVFKLGHNAAEAACNFNKEIGDDSKRTNRTVMVPKIPIQRYESGK